MQEIERKFLVRSMPRNLGMLSFVEIHQGYLACEKGRHVRVRRIADSYSLTAKLRRGMGRDEETIALTAAKFALFWPLTEGRRVQKTRYCVPHGHLMIEIDIFKGPHVGLIVAEVEFPDEQSCGAFIPPAWLGEEVTHDLAYRNTSLAVADICAPAPTTAKEATSPMAGLVGHLISRLEKERIIERAQCTRCEGSEVIDHSGSEKKGKLVLEGVCAKCGHRVVRVVGPPKLAPRLTSRLKPSASAAGLRSRSRSLS